MSLVFSAFQDLKLSLSYLRNSSKCDWHFQICHLQVAPVFWTNPALCCLLLSSFAQRLSYHCFQFFASFWLWCLHWFEECFAAWLWSWRLAPWLLCCWPECSVLAKAYPFASSTPRASPLYAMATFSSFSRTLASSLWCSARSKESSLRDPSYFFLVSMVRKWRQSATF